MTIKIHKATHKIINKNGASLWLPSNIVGGRFNLTDPDIYSQSSTQLYPLGTKLEYADGRLFRYGKFGATSTKPPIGRFVVNANAAPSCTGNVGLDGFEGNLYAAAVAGQEYVDLWTIIGASGTGYSAATVFTENFFEDGMLAIYPSTPNCEIRICGNDATVTPYTRVYLDAPLPAALTVGTTGAYITSGTLTGSTGGSGVTTYKSIFSQLKDTADEGTGFTSCMGMFLGPTFTTDYFGWIQRRGRCAAAPVAYFGDTAQERAAIFWYADGTICVGGYGGATPATGWQIVGYLTQRTVSGYGDLEIWLQLE